ncbi:MAG: hypothetical protein ABEJ72_02940 [Candidatus Aenigmatarchaeota archaeon]
MRKNSLERFLEFLLIGVALGVTEDVIAVKMSTGAEIDLNVIFVVVLVAIPFAIFSELVVDRKSFGLIKKLASLLGRKDDTDR